ncbi:MAG: 3-phosphoshikimate 1-carboxyvinyltransferase [Firmicutes bacterium]|nr:3-phosphoshikimate 1-carboxyvinyltransferase [Bacillota bacterium]MCM1401053.1 3-phosphoshikimate 1-carboxyvinyltransferase [Bacteroides sp.]
MDYRILPPEELPEAEIKLPLSKSMSNRALIINALGAFPSTNNVTARCIDTDVLRGALESDSDVIDIDGAGTAMRFLTALFAATPGRNVTLTGNERMRERPIAPLVDALRKLGAQITYTGGEGFPPLFIEGRELHGGELTIDASMSSQFVSALLMIAPRLRGGLKIILETEIGSLPYVDLTLEMMRRAGAEAERERLEITVAEGAYTKPITSIEADWSAASYWYEMEAVSSGFFTLLGLEANSPQGDAAVAKLFANISVNTEFTSDYDSRGPAAELLASPDLAPRLVTDLSATPDLTPAVAVTCALVGIPFRLSGLSTLCHKECNRLEALRLELDKMGVECQVIGNHTLEWNGRRMPLLGLPEFDTYGDHRMAMAFAAVSLYIPGIKVKDVEVVGKSYPEFWEHLQQAGFTLVDGNVSYNELFEEGEGA